MLSGKDRFRRGRERYKIEEYAASDPIGLEARRRRTQTKGRGVPAAAGIYVLPTPSDGLRPMWHGLLPVAQDPPDSASHTIRDGRHLSHEIAGVGEIEDSEKREVTKLGRENSIERQMLQLHGSDTIPVLAAGDTDPVAEGHGGGPVARKDTERVRELDFDGQQRGEVSINAELQLQLQLPTALVGRLKCILVHSPAHRTAHIILERLPEDRRPRERLTANRPLCREPDLAAHGKAASRRIWLTANHLVTIYLTSPFTLHYTSHTSHTPSPVVSRRRLPRRLPPRQPRVACRHASRLPLRQRACHRASRRARPPARRPAAPGRHRACLPRRPAAPDRPAAPASRAGCAWPATAANRASGASASRARPVAPPPTSVPPPTLPRLPRRSCASPDIRASPDDAGHLCSREEAVRQRVMDYDAEAGVGDMLNDFGEAHFNGEPMEEEPEATAKAYYNMLSAAQQPLHGHTKVSQLDGIARLMSLNKTVVMVKRSRASSP
ncbi:hypothetical protein HU200_044145 [Digitaria exilis]|uniref:Uncharacterized protein n=1 Tax=Digitaria exilis TaxID=1010633 RepID=A0A835B288_9POAL|nr:hypothetical protein HU200_044145 [Digitaria exilis]